MALFTLKVARPRAQGDRARLIDPHRRTIAALLRTGRRLKDLVGVVIGARVLVTGVEIATREEVVERLEDLAAARRETEAWRLRAADLEARVAELEGEIAASSLVAMDLRARVVCLHGKLAATAATARYRSFSNALGSRAADA